MRVLHHTLPEVSALLGQLQKCQFKFVIAGGYPRDLAHGCTPKDMDLCVYGLDADNIELTEHLIAHAQARFDFVLEHEVKHDLRIYRAFRFRIKNTDLHFDLIIYKAEFKDRATLLGTMDYNLNAYVLDLKTGMPVFVGQNEGTLTEQRVGGCADPKRKIYIADKAKALGWEVPAAVAQPQGV
ncbi:MAG: hypothetical protein GY833_21760 [Aestuariibacter sp.]|nr:hypothetical protein [Aestuariibacter sp.]